MNVRIHSFLLVLTAAIAAGCGDSQTAAFSPPRTVDKEQRPIVWDAPRDERLGVRAVPPRPGAGDASATAPGPGGRPGGTVWTGDTPAGWEALPAQPNRFRDAIWRVAGQPDTEAYLTASVGGGVRGNMQRWYESQFGQPTTPPLESLPVVDLAGRPGRLAEMQGTFAGKKDWAALIAFVPDGDKVTTFKFTGPAAVVAANKEPFLALAKSLRSASAGPDANAPPIVPGQPMPPGHPPVGGSDPHAGVPDAPPLPAAGAEPFTATTPAGWTVKAGSNKALHHTFGTAGDVYVSQLGGTLKSSLDIWRGEMGIAEPLTDAQLAALPKVAFLGEDAVLLDLSGDMTGMVRQLPGARMLLAARADGGTITFCKLAGPAAEVEGQVDTFRTFCGSVRRAR